MSGNEDFAIGDGVWFWRNAEDTGSFARVSRVWKNGRYLTLTTPDKKTWVREASRVQADATQRREG